MLLSAIWCLCSSLKLRLRFTLPKEPFENTNTKRKQRRNSWESSRHDNAAGWRALFWQRSLCIFRNHEQLKVEWHEQSGSWGRQCFLAACQKQQQPLPFYAPVIQYLNILHEKCSFSCEQKVVISFHRVCAHPQYEGRQQQLSTQSVAPLWNEASPWFIFWIGEQMVSLVVTTGLQEALIPLATIQKLCTGSRAVSRWWPLNVPDGCWSARRTFPPASPAAVLATCNSISGLVCLKHLWPLISL